MSKGFYWLLRQRRGNKCERCGVTLEQLIATGHKCSNHLQVHHIKPKRSYPQLAKDETNLIVLCQKCHEDVDPWIERMLRAGRLSVTTVTPFSSELGTGKSSVGIRGDHRPTPDDPDKGTPDDVVAGARPSSTESGVENRREDQNES